MPLHPRTPEQRERMSIAQKQSWRRRRAQLKAANGKTSPGPAEPEVLTKRPEHRIEIPLIKSGSMTAVLIVTTKKDAWQFATDIINAAR